MDTVLEIERQIENLPKEEFDQLASWFLEKTEDEGLLRACMEVESEGIADEVSAAEVISNLRQRAGL